jgi:hypothetical protein
MNNSREDSEKKRIPRRVKRGLSLGAATLFAAGLLWGVALQQVSIGVRLFALGIVLFAARGYLDAGNKAVTGALIFVALVVGGQLLGIPGALLAIPVAEIIRIVVTELLAYRRTTQEVNEPAVASSSPPATSE